MSELNVKLFHLKQPDGDEIEKSIEFLDKVLSEFEDPDSLPHIEQEPREPETPTQGNHSEDDGYMSMNGKKELKITDDINDNQPRSKKSFSDAKIRYELSNITDNIETTPSLTTLPKARPLNVNPSKYASLPCSTQSKYTTVDADSLAPNGRNKLGIDISAVHDAVLRGIARIPETIVNEHPVTIYPGRSSPAKSKSSTNRNLSGSSYDMKVGLLCLGDNASLENDSNDDDINQKYEDLGSASNEMKSLEIPDNGGPLQQATRILDIIRCKNEAPAEDEFSDDSLENAVNSNIAANVPSFLGNDSAILTEKCSPGIAWEIKLYKKDELNAHLISNNIIPFSSNLIDCENSVVSTPCNSLLSTEQSFSSDWPEPPEGTEDEAGSIITDSEDILPIQTTIIPNGTFIIRKGRERKQVFDLQEFVDPAVEVEFDHEPDLVDKSQEVLNIEEANEIIQKSMMQPQMNVLKYRHSIDSTMHTSMHTEYKTFLSKPEDIQIRHATSLTPSRQEYFIKKDCDSLNKCITNDDLNIPLVRVASLPIITQSPVLNSFTAEVATTPRRDLAPPIEEDEEPESEAAPLRQIENNISALLRGDIPIARVSDIQSHRRPVGFRSGVHKSESAKEMLLSQHIFGPLPSPPSSSADEIDGLPPLPPLPSENNADVYWTDGTGHRSTSLDKIKYENRYRDSIDAPPVPPHRYPSCENTLKTMSMDPKYFKSTSPHAPGSTRSHDRMPLSNSRKRMPGLSLKQSPHEERRLQTSYSLPETPIFARGCDVPRTPHRRTQELPTCGGSRTAPRPLNSLNSSIIGIAGSTLNGRPAQRSINHAILSSEMLRIAGGPGRGWYPKQRQSRPVSNENLDRIHGGGRVWDTNSASRKPLTLPPNLSPNFFKKSPTDALRRVTSLLIRKGDGSKEAEKKAKVKNLAAHRTLDSGTLEHRNTTQKKKGFFKSLWKKTKHYSIEQ